VIVASATRYVLPLREGGSLPAVVEADDGETYVVKFRGAGQGTRALIAEVLGGELARAAGLPVPALAVIQLDAAIGRNEAHDEIRDLLLASVGSNLGLRFLPAALPFDPAADAVDGGLASRVVAFDAFLQNVDRTPRNPNLLWSGGALWLIDHGAALYWQHDWDGGLRNVDARFPMIKDHVLWPWATDLAGAGAALIASISDAAIDDAAAAIPADWFAPGHTASAYAARLRARRDAAPTYLDEAIRARV
jgi:hypothetical protein